MYILHCERFVFVMAIVIRKQSTTYKQNVTKNRHENAQHFSAIKYTRTSLPRVTHYLIVNTITRK